MIRYVAVDLGSSGGIITVGNCTEFEVIHRFPCPTLLEGGFLRWDIDGIHENMETGLSIAFAKYGTEIRSIGIDAWGVDYGLLDSGGALLGNPIHYRDTRTDGVMERLFERLPSEELYARTGIQVMQVNTIFQLFSETLAGLDTIHKAAHYLSIPDLLNYRLTGVIANEYTEATTTQLYDPFARAWDTELIEEIGVDPAIFSEPIMPGTPIGPLLPEVAERIGAPRGITVFTPACHDTASAIAAVPATTSGEFAYLSSGTWSLLGVEMTEPIATPRSYRGNFTNEGGAFGSITYHKNIQGLWILQECRSAWREEKLVVDGEAVEWESMIHEAENYVDDGARIDVNDPVFLKHSTPGETMPDRIRSFLRREGVSPPDSIGGIVRCVLASLAEEYSEVLRQLEITTEKEIETIHIIGGGSQNELLNRLTTGTTGKRVVAGPVEATAIGNILIQAVGSGEVVSIEEGRKLIARALPPVEY